MATRTARKTIIKREQIKFETGIPIPESNVPDGGQSPYPFTKMGVGDSFSVPAAGAVATKIYHAVQQAASYYRKRNPGVNFITRSIEKDGVVRCWRITDDKQAGPPAETPVTTNTAIEP